MYTYTPPLWMWPILILQARAGVCTIDPLRFRLADRTAHLTGWVMQSQPRHTITYYTHMCTLWMFECCVRSVMLQIANYPPPRHPCLLLSFYCYSLILPSNAFLTLSSHHDTLLSSTLHFIYLPFSSIFIFIPVSYFASLLMMLLKLCYAAVSVWGTKLPRVSPTIAVSTLRCLREYISSGLEENAAERLWDALWGSSGNFNMKNAVESLSFYFVWFLTVLDSFWRWTSELPNSVSFHIISYHIISYHIISYHIISYHIISYHIISYHIIS